MVFVAFIAAVSGTAFVYGLSTVIGFPVPFAQVTASITGLPTAIFTMSMILREKLRQDTTLQTDLRNQFFVFVGETAMTYVYPIYFLAFTSTASYAQSAITFLLPFLKIGLRNHFSKALTGLDDVKPPFIVFNVDIFSAMYVAICMQTSHYWVNTLLIMVVDIVQILISVYDVRRVLKEIRALVNLDKYDGSLLDLCLTIASAPEVRRELDHQCSSLKLGKSRNRQGALQSASRIVPSLPASRPSMTIIHENTIVAKLRPSKRVKLVHKLMSVLYIAEFVLLIEFAEVMIPILYSIYLVAMSYLPNRQHYDQLATLTEDELVSSILSVMLNAGLEFLSFCSICWLLGRELRLKSLHLVGFSLEHHRHTIIPILTSWVTYVIQQSLNHNGACIS
ncbi:hypothetical protein Poli38472_000577 [Pythium oligandrum]|uniref:Uncharacterized protein n=1 Tax=Pythium oligandrum TaxID=41045 RepID=A0A8K1CCD5_PYTOL|nr:hypothetical protein Poli38472_000577 [Pythium oligandrum]|eukprot:TMW60535.1 hypothetical protein Poli38472_000577 [Pythium oligandrum]